VLEKNDRQIKLVKIQEKIVLKNMENFISKYCLKFEKMDVNFSQMEN